MMRSSELRAAAAAVEVCESVAGWRDRLPDFATGGYGVMVSWSFARSCTGYEELSKEVSAVVNEGMKVIVEEALDRIEQRALAAIAQAVSSPPGKEGVG